MKTTRKISKALRLRKAKKGLATIGVSSDAVNEFSRVIIRSIIVILLAVGWFLLSGFLFLDFLTSFNYYNTVLSNQGTNSNDVWFFWGWVPTLFILVIGIFWSSGILGKIFYAIVD